MRQFFRQLNWWIRRRRKEEELMEELQFHLSEEAEERQSESAARRELGNLALLQEATRAAWGWTFWERLVQDVRYAWRTMAANKAFTGLAILSLALGIGANTAIFSFMDSILLRSLPVRDPQALVRLSWHTRGHAVHGIEYHDSYVDDAKIGMTGGGFSYPAFELFGKNDSVFSSVFGYQGAGNLTLTALGQAELSSGEYVSGDYFRGLGVPPAAGRLIGPDDDHVGAPAVVAISFALSQKRFGGPERAAGQSILINDIPFTVAGVTPPEFFGADPELAPDFYLPMHTSLLLQAPNPRHPPASLYFAADYDWVDVMARLHPGVSLARAQATLAPQFRQFEATATTNDRNDLPALVMAPAAGGLDSLRRRYSKPLYLLMALVGLILAIACANIANLQLARVAVRRREMAVRLSMGAGRGRVIRQLLTESLLLAVLGGAAGVAFALWGIRVLTLLLGNGRENFTLRADLNWHVLAVAATLSLLTGILFGMAPALHATRVDLIPALKVSRTGERRSRSMGGVSLSRLLVVAQIAISLLILVAAGLFVRTLSNLQSIQLGFHRESVLTFALNARQAGHREPEIATFYNRLRKRFSQIPGVRSASLSEFALMGQGTMFTPVTVSGARNGGSEPGRRSAKILAVGAGFLSTMEIPILLGREIDERDLHDAPMVAVVSEEFARDHFGDRNPLGEHLRLPTDRCPKCEIEIVGVARDARYGRLKEDPDWVVYLPFGQPAWDPVSRMIYELRTSGNPQAYVHTVREVVHQEDARVPVADVKTQSALIDGMISREITFARLCTAFGILALLIACVGLYGTVAYNVARRVGEIGIRMALGARQGAVVWMVLREVLILTAAGLAISVPVVAVTSKFVASFLFEMKANDPMAMAAAVTILGTAAILAGYLPARRASRIDPMLALRHE